MSVSYTHLDVYKRQIIGSGRVPISTKTRYFLRGETNFNKTHFPSGQVSDGGSVFIYPELSKEDYE